MMPLNSDIIISDTSCLILLNKIDAIFLLKEMASEIYVTPTIKTEFGKRLPDWIKIKLPRDQKYQEFLTMDIDAGEASAIALSLEIENSILIIDDLKGRKLAQRLNLKFSGTLGLILRAKQFGVLEDIDLLLDKIAATNFRISTGLIEFVREQAKREP